MSGYEEYYPVQDGILGERMQGGYGIKKVVKNFAPHICKLAICKEQW